MIPVTAVWAVTIGPRRLGLARRHSHSRSRNWKCRVVSISHHHCVLSSSRLACRAVNAEWLVNRRSWALHKSVVPTYTRSPTLASPTPSRVFVSVLDSPYSATVSIQHAAIPSIWPGQCFAARSASQHERTVAFKCSWTRGF